MTKFKLYSSIIATAGVIGLVAFLFWQVNSLKSEKTALEWKIITAEAKIDTVFIATTYAVPETTWKRVENIVYRDSLQVDTVYENIPIMTGNMSFDTTKIFGQDHNPLSVQVSGQFWYPEEFSHRNWLLIVPEFKTAPVIAPERKIKNYGVGVGFQIQTPWRVDIGAWGRFKRVSMGLNRQIAGKAWTFNLNYEFLSF